MASYVLPGAIRMRYHMGPILQMATHTVKGIKKNKNKIK